jgi:hypothetical protein
VAEDQEVREQELRKVCREKAKIFARSRREIKSRLIRYGRHMERVMYFGGGSLQKKSRRSRVKRR